MGLDHGLVRRPIANDAELVTWRKNWALREWFAECLHRFQDNGETIVYRDDLEALKADIITVLDEPERAADFFPQMDGKYDENYFQMLRELKQDVEEIIVGTNWNSEQIVYWEWY